MKFAQRVALLLGLSVVLTCSWLAPMDAPAMTQVDAGLKRALVSFASARALSGVISVIQGTQLDIQPAGVGVTLSPGQVLAPVNELVKHFADLMLMACVAFGIQKVLITVSGYWVISLLLTVAGVVWVSMKFVNRKPLPVLSQALVILLMLRFAIPVAMLGTDVLSQKFLAPDYLQAQSGLDLATVQASNVKTPQPPSDQGKSWLPSMPNWLPGISDIKAKYDELKRTIERSTEHMVKLMVIFLLQTLLVPLLLLWGLYRLATRAVQPLPMSGNHMR